MANRNLVPRLVLILILILFILFAAWYIRSHASPQPSALESPAAPVPAHVGPADIYPDPVRTPGAINPQISQQNLRQTICNSRWSTKSVRPDEEYTHRLKVEQIREYGYSDSRLRDYEEDHFIPLELGGNPTDPRNLWPEPFETSIPDGGARAKNEVESYLRAEVCSGSLTLEQAQHEIAQDWYRVYRDSVPH